MTKPKQRKNPFFLLSFIPAVAYWILETYTTLEIALIGGIILGILEMSFEKWYSGHIHTLSKVNLSLIVVLGGVALVAHEGVWFRLQPTFSGYGIAVFLIYKMIKKESLLWQMLKDMGQMPPFPEAIYKTIELHMVIFLLLFSTWMIKVAVYHTTANWLFWKTGGFYIVFGAFMVLEMFYLRFRMKRSGP